MDISRTQRHHSQRHPTPCSFVPPWLLERLGRPVGDLDVAVRAARARGWGEPGVRPARFSSLSAEGPVQWTVHDAGGTERLPGTPVRTTGSEPSGDVAVDEAASGIEATLAMWAEGFGRSSYDGSGAPVSLTVHYGQDYDNAFWDGEQLVFGDGDGEIFDRFTKPVEVLAHEFAHAVTEHTSGFVYRDQPGALNESMSDVFAACLKQRLLGQGAADADWLIGEGLFLPGVSARALRDMAAPGTAFDDPRLGTDPQVGHLDDFIETTDDNGGVHLNSGIPNRAFQLAAVAIGGSSLEGAGQIWYDALTGADVSPTSDFAAFAAATVGVAGDHADAVREAWRQVGVPLSAAGSAGASGDGGVEPHPGGAPPGEPPSTSDVVRVTRSGGFAGRTVSAEVDLRVADPALDPVRELCGRVDLRAARQGLPKPDMFVYTFQLGDGPPVLVPEQHLSDDLRDLAQRVLAAGGDR